MLYVPVPYSSEGIGATSKGVLKGRLGIKNSKDTPTETHTYLSKDMVSSTMNNTLLDMSSSRDVLPCAR